VPAARGRKKTERGGRQAERNINNTMSVPPAELPANIDAERFVLGSVLAGTVEFAAVRHSLAANDFSLKKHRRIYSSILDLDARGEPIERVTIAEELKRRNQLDSVGGLSYLVTLDDGLPQIPNIDAYVGIVKKMAALRSVAIECDRLGTRAIQREDPDTLIASGAKLFHDLAANNGQRTETAPSIPTWPEGIREDGFYGIAGELVRAVEPHTEADPAALLVQFLVAWGSLAGRGAHFLAEADRHHTNEYVVIVGTTSKGRKGTSWGRILHVLNAVDSHWAENCQVAGLGSGEALIDAVAGEDRRALILEGEFARLLAVVNREGNTTSANLRNGWDSGNLAITTRERKQRVRGAHVAMIAHVTREELLRRLDSTECANGFGNRILWVCARRSKRLPHGGGDMEIATELLDRLQRATDYARKMGNTRMRFDDAASRLWEQVYDDLSEGRPGMLGSMTSRAEAHVARLALIFALLDCADEIQVEHLRAALAVWRYCDASARFIWGDAIGDPTADEILRELRSGPDGLTRTEIRDIFARNRTGQEIDRALGVLSGLGLARYQSENSGGRPTTRWFAV
jgi:hypothetical protein